MNALSEYLSAPTTGLIVVDHGSRVQASNDMIHQVVELLCDSFPYSIVEPAHMELAEPSIRTAFKKCVERGAEQIIIHPYFLFPGRHWRDDIPALAKEAQQEFPQVQYAVTKPLGIHPAMADVVNARIHEAAESFVRADGS